MGISEGIAGGRPLHDLLEEKITMEDDWELDPSDVVVFVDQKLGEGAFGEVYKGTVSGSCLMKNPLLSSTVKKAAFIPVAIKVLKCMYHVHVHVCGVHVSSFLHACSVCLVHVILHYSQFHALYH